VLARKPLRGTVAANVARHGTGALNVDGCRIGFTEDTDDAKRQRFSHAHGGFEGKSFAIRDRSTDVRDTSPKGRWPPNVVLGCACDGDHDAGCAVALLDAQSGERDGRGGHGRSGEANGYDGGWGSRPVGVDGYGDTGGASRYFYTAKASRSEREQGLLGLDAVRRSDGRQKDIENPRLRTNERRNHHPTVKPVDLMQWLVRLVTPPGGLVLDPFVGSGSTGIAALREGFAFVGIDQDAEYVEIARHRIRGDAPLFNQAAEVPA
jgi:site-specific DNA-methyltransferase (adenine-specific)